MWCICGTYVNALCDIHGDVKWRDEEADVNDAGRDVFAEPLSTGTWVPIELGQFVGGEEYRPTDEPLSPSDILDRCKAIAQAKSHDYTTAGDLNGPGRFENFDRAQVVASWFRDDVDKPFAVLIGVKLARLAALLSTDRTPANEAIEDTFVDLTNYCALWGSRRSQR